MLHIKGLSKKEGGNNNMTIEKIYAIDITGTYPIAAVQYKNCSPSWKQYHNDKQIQEYLKTHDDYEVNTNKKLGEYL